ncbi:unnamed protein product [Pieris brassicae]|uniref:Reverse transcriptase domain-containing protein n=1 Tax=Pieris brassicae TaxID=7116 RepID=A0A9P0TB48_PIEBR|nr:unnamed protein product [Pieris brassicae]
MLRVGYFPNARNLSDTVMIYYTAGKLMNDKTSYPPISLLPTLSKILEKTIPPKIMPSLMERKVIPDHQCDFRQ